MKNTHIALFAVGIILGGAIMSALLGFLQMPQRSYWEEDSTRLAQSMAEVTSYPFPPLDTGCTYSGTLADYAVSAGSAAVDLALTNHFDTDFDQNLQVLDVIWHFAPESALRGATNDS